MGNMSRFGRLVVLTFVAALASPSAFAHNSEWYEYDGNCLIEVWPDEFVLTLSCDGGVCCQAATTRRDLGLIFVTHTCCPAGSECRFHSDVYKQIVTSSCDEN